MATTGVREAVAVLAARARRIVHLPADGASGPAGVDHHSAESVRHSS